jgi:acyl-CoA-binding protein
MCTATVGNVVGVRPGLWDMLGRAKWYAPFLGYCLCDSAEPRR